MLLSELQRLECKTSVSDPTHGSTQIIRLESTFRPAIAIPNNKFSGEFRFTLQIRSSGLVRIHDSVLMAESKYKCLLVSDITTTTEVISILFRCYGLEDVERVERYQLCEVGPDGSERKLESEECPVIAQSTWKMTKRFVLKRIVPSSRHSTQPQQGYKNLPSAIDFHPPTAEEDKDPSDNLYSQPCDAMPLNNLYCNPTYIRYACSGLINHI